eukprot:gnl/MRDRNA2_/MRDRNA2_139111_c0_seq1.p2 gnl/MRDRNA2_/MRDRNA2_139111_c0~~gnl/MRDRNA2_/MRDRNA2_139111_c0_seq1.p2  ORF type:complete len:123 (+),score=34.40 gnl/MRDRNA2_/MRDRNA2_139111_c0_seq1:72-440(+)
MADDAKEKQAAEMAKEFEKQAEAIRYYYDFAFKERLVEGVHEVAKVRPEDPNAALSGFFQGKKSLGEIATTMPQTTDEVIKSMPPRQYVRSVLGPKVVPGMMKCFEEKHTRPINRLGELLAP